MSSVESVHPVGRVLPFWASLWAMVGISLVNMLGALDQTIVSTALPSIVSELKGFDYYAWIVTSYLLTSVVTVPIFGRLGDYFGRKPFVIAAIATFTASSVLCGTAHNITFLLMARALQGVGGGMMVGTAFASIPDLFPDPHSRVRWQVVMAGAYGIGTAAGPSLGGFLSEHYSWRAAFLINLPVGLVSLACVIVYLPFFRHSHSEKVRIDWGGAFLISLALGTLQLFVELFPKYGWSLLMLVLLLFVIASAICLLWWERRALHPFIPLDLFRDKNLVVVFLLSALVGFVMFSLIFYAPLLLQGGFGFSPQYAGLLVTPLAGCVAIGSILNSRIVTGLRNPTLILTLGYSFLALSCFGMALVDAGTSHLLLEGAMLIGGIGMGFIFNNLNVFSQELAGRQRFGITTALIQSTRMVGGMFGTALVGTLVSRLYVYKISASIAAPATGNIPPQLLQQIQDPQILVNRQGEDLLLRAAINGPALIQAARNNLVSAIHLGFFLTAIFALIAVWQVRSISHMRFRRSSGTRPSAQNSV